jgi:hypothetical protein
MEIKLETQARFPYCPPHKKEVLIRISESENLHPAFYVMQDADQSGFFDKGDLVKIS